MPRTAPLFSLHNATGESLPRAVLRLLRRAVKPSMKAFAWVAPVAPIGSPLRASDALLDVCLYSDLSGLEVTVGERRFGFGIEPR